MIRHHTVMKAGLVTKILSFKLKKNNIDSFLYSFITMATTLHLSGIMAVPDDFERIRVLLMNPLPSGMIDKSANVLREASINYPNLSFKLHPRDTEGVIGEFWATLPKYKKHWLSIAADLRGREVKVEVTLRPYFVEGKRGHALDVVMIEPYS